MSKSITQDMAYRQSLMKYGVSRASRKYNKSRSYIYFWKQRWDGTTASLACQSRRPRSHPNQHTEDELKLIRDMRRRNPELGMIELWHRLKKRGYTRCPESLFRVMRKMGLFPQEKPNKTYTPKPYEQMTRPGERIQVDVKVVPRKCSAAQSCGCSSTRPSTSSPGCVFWPPIRSSPPTPRRISYTSWWSGMRAAVSAWNASKRTTVLSLPTVFQTVAGTNRRCLNGLPQNWGFGTS